MRRAFFGILVIVLIAFGFAAIAIAQGSNKPINDEKCVGRTYQPKEISLRANISSKPSPNYSAEAIAHYVRGRVVLSAVLCRTGRVTNVQVIESLPFGMTEKAIEAARAIKFESAERNGRRVSEVFRLEYNFGFLGDRGSTAQEPTVGRLVERVEITGLRSKSSQEIMAHLKTRPGEPYRPEQVMAEFRSLLALGVFDKKESRVLVEDGIRGGINVVFELVELQPK
jgi:TonB family protein